MPGASNAQKTPLVASLNDFVQQKADAINQLLGKSLPASVVSVDSTQTIVTIKFEVNQPGITLPQVTCPVYGPKYVRWPIKAGDMGVALAADFYLGQMSGLGNGVATLDPEPNLSALTWFPLGNSGFGASQDPNAVVLSAPNGVIAKTDDGIASMVLNEDGITFTFGSHTIVINEDGVFIDQINFLPHKHSGVMAGGADTGPVAG